MDEDSHIQYQTCACNATQILDGISDWLEVSSTTLMIQMDQTEYSVPPEDSSIYLCSTGLANHLTMLNILSFNICLHMVITT